VRRPWGWATLAAILVALAACDDDPSGPGTFTVTVEADAVALGAAVVELRGNGLQDIEPLASGWTHLERVAAGGGGQPDVHRLLIVSQEGGTLSAVLRVSDVGARPTASVVVASDANDQPLAALGDVTVRLRR
jgi:hypothetical protein